MDVEAMPVYSPNRVPVWRGFGLPARKLSPYREPYMWRVMKRLTEPSRKLTTPVFRPPPTNGCPGMANCLSEKRVESYRCSCHQRALNLIDNIWQSGNARSWEKSVLRKSDYGCISKVRGDIKSNESQQFPLSTVRIRWKTDAVTYDLPTLARLLSQFGNVVTLQYISANSVVVVFDDLGDSCRLLAIRHVVYGVNGLHCRWWHKCMENKHFIQPPEGANGPQNLHVKYNPFVSY